MTDKYKDFYHTTDGPVDCDESSYSNLSCFSIEQTLQQLEPKKKDNVVNMNVYLYEKFQQEKTAADAKTEGGTFYQGWREEFYQLSVEEKEAIIEETGPMEKWMHDYCVKERPDLEILDSLKHRPKNPNK